MKMLTIPYNEDILVATGLSAKAFEQDIRFWLAVKLFELRRLSLGKAAEFCGMSKLRFMDELGQLEIPTINLDTDQIEEELQYA